MLFEFGKRVVVISLDSRVFQGAVHAFDLAVGPRMAEFCQAMLDAQFDAGGIKKMDFSLRKAARNHQFIGKLHAIVS